MNTVQLENATRTGKPEYLAVLSFSSGRFDSGESEMKVCTKCKEEKEESFFYKDKRTKDGHKPFCKVCEKIKAVPLDPNAKSKKCVICHIDKPKEAFHKRTLSYDGRASRCAECLSATRDRLSAKEYRKQNKEKSKDYSITYRQNNKERKAQIDKKYRERNRDTLRVKKLTKRKTDPLYSAAHKARSMLHTALKRKGIKKGEPTSTILGCSFSDLKKHLESKFSDGMSWEAKGEWHIDHIIPLASAKTPEDVIKLNHYSNLQPLWAKENLRKGAKMPHEYYKEQYV